MLERMKVIVGDIWIGGENALHDIYYAPMLEAGDTQVCACRKGIPGLFWAERD